MKIENLKKYFPIILLVIGVIVILGVILFIKKGKSQPAVEEEEIITEIPLEKRPVASLTPSEDGHWLKLKISKIQIEAASLDYELLYKLPDGRTQGVPGNITLGGSTDLERDLLLGSESSGKFRYDEGVEGGTLTLRFRNANGKLTGKLVTEFRLLKDTVDLASSDGKFEIKLDKKVKTSFFIVMESFGLPGGIANVKSGPYGVFSSVDALLSGTITMEGKPYFWDGSSWEEIKNNQTSNLGIFVGTSE